MLQSKALERTKVRINESVAVAFKHWKKSDLSLFKKRLSNHLDQYLYHLHILYNDQPDWYLYAEKLVIECGKTWEERSDALKKIDKQREKDPTWYKSHHMLGAVCYVDLFAGNLRNIEDHLDYLKELGVTYLHLMPLFDKPKEENDGGYAVSSYRKIASELGSMEDLRHLTEMFRKEGISLVVDFINNHTSDEHIWAKKAKKGDQFYKDFYFFFPDKTIPDQYEKNLREIFPEIRRGNYHQNKETGEWVWSTFHDYQWDLNYSNPEVLIAIAKEMLFLANQGVDILRLDAVPFTWKQMGTNCENLPQAHSIIKVLNVAARIAAPGLLFKSEAIVHPDEVAKYIDVNECQISYNPTVMAMIWESLATREVKLLRKSLEHRFAIPDDCAWVNYIRSHDDIGWTFSDEDAYEIGIFPEGHRYFLNHFYAKDFSGSFAKGMPFQYNPTNGDLRVCGTTASLAGLEQAANLNDEGRHQDALDRIILMYTVVFSIGGIPLIYLGDEVGTLNDYSFESDPSKSYDARWVHRVKTDWELNKSAQKGEGDAGYLFETLKKRIQLKKQIPVFGSNALELVETHNPHVLGYLKSDSEQKVVVLANFSEHQQEIRCWLSNGVDRITNHPVDLNGKITLDSYQCMWVELI